jgi:muramoyltetrapeptide carboxypeptidase
MWNYLCEGDIIDIVATTPGIETATLEQDLQFLCQFIRTNLHLTPRVNFKTLLDGSEFFSSSAQEIRQIDLNRALLAPDSKAIWFIRGGYGSARLLSNLASIPKPPVAKLLIGYSDINCIHLWVNKFWQWPSLHARVLYEYLHPQDSSDLESLKNIILGKQTQIVFSNLIPLNTAATIPQNISASITGGTIQVLQSGIGLPWQFDANNKILFFEEIFDRGVRLDRTLNHFDQLGLLKSAKAILFGDILCGTESNGTSNCDIAVKRFAESMDIPVLSIPNIGHGKLNHPLPLNTEVSLKLNLTGAELICSTGGK